jgi:gamma-glutamylcyclotransferase (GGCT)/AIG2-like uncharacterized protein YtfP
MTERLSSTSSLPGRDRSLAFAYGSNTDLAHLDAWCRENGYGTGLFRPVGTAELADAALAFNHYSIRRKGGALNLRAHRGGLVKGLLLEVQPGGWEALDHKEGVRSRAYRAVRRHAIGARGEAVPVTTYVASPQHGELHHTPAPGYVETVLKGYMACGINAAALEDAAAGRRSDPGLDAVFVYGTLLRGESRAGAVSAGNPSCVLLAEAPGVLTDLDAFPAMELPRPGGPADAWVEGEFVRFPDISRTLAALDTIEGAQPFGAPGGLYRRTVIDVGVGDGRRRRAWVYVMDEAERSGHRVIASGSWREHRRRRDQAISAIVAQHIAREPGFYDRLAAEVRSIFAPDLPPPFPLTPAGVAQAVASGELSERRLARGSGDWAVQIRQLASATC